MTESEPTAVHLLTTIQAWQRGERPREDVVLLLSQVPSEDGELIREVIRGVCQLPGAATPHGDSTDTWRSELMASRARTWRVPDTAGLLVGPSVLILTDGREGAVLRRDGVQCLPASVCASMMLLCETIVMAHTALDAHEMQKLQRQRVEATSTSLSEIDRIP
ncbi:hypothetical protein [Deinococcus koreensis]|uniref:Uncharacterized protein n=1 Tax=Deinococcus koreensis TaxID=2054903 RepID=A0A2K3V0W1_9DEIO|nr:hypothetical protein [Deinococcus koreensis]PNY82422.1 hypothetical protein CVO96_14615 [Deinococcus koreensis]